LLRREVRPPRNDGKQYLLQESPITIYHLLFQQTLHHHLHRFPRDLFPFRAFGVEQALQQQAHRRRDDQPRGQVGVDIHERAFGDSLFDERGEMLVIAAIRRDAGLPDGFITAGLQQEFEEHRQVFAGRLEHVRKVFRHHLKSFRDGTILRGFDGLIESLQPAVEQRQKDVLLGFEMMVERALADARLRADIVHTGFVVAID